MKSRVWEENPWLWILTCHKLNLFFFKHPPRTAFSHPSGTFITFSTFKRRQTTLRTQLFSLKSKNFDTLIFQNGSNKLGNLLANTTHKTQKETNPKEPKVSFKAQKDQTGNLLINVLIHSLHKCSLYVHILGRGRKQYAATPAVAKNWFLPHPSPARWIWMVTYLFFFLAWLVW